MFDITGLVNIMLGIFVIVVLISMTVSLRRIAKAVEGLNPPGGSRDDQHPPL